MREGITAIRRKRLCINCLNDNHQTSSCYAENCKKCSKVHNTFLHFESKQTENNESSLIDKEDTESKSEESTCVHNSTNFIVLLSTAVMKIKA